MAEFMQKMNRIGRCAGMFRSRGTGEDLPGMYHSYVFYISKNPGVSQDKISRHLCLNKSSVTRHLSYLEQNGYVTRKSGDEDKREMLVFPTQKMLCLYPRLKEAAKEWSLKLTEGIDEADFETFLSVLDLLYKKAKSISAFGGEER